MNTRIRPCLMLILSGVCTMAGMAMIRSSPLHRDEWYQVRSDPDTSPGTSLFMYDPLAGHPGRVLGQKGLPGDLRIHTRQLHSLVGTLTWKSR